MRGNVNLPVVYSIVNHVLTQQAVDSVMILSSSLTTEISVGVPKPTTYSMMNVFVLKLILNLLEDVTCVMLRIARDALRPINVMNV